MRFSATNFRPKPALRWVAVFCALTVWALGLLAVSPELHAALHTDADHADHACAITLFSHGVDNSTTQTDLVVEPLVMLAGSVDTSTTRPALAPDYWLLPGRAPPIR